MARDQGCYRLKPKKNKTIPCFYEDLAIEFQSLIFSRNCTKRTAVRLAISNSIKIGVLRPGDYLPPEKVLAEVLKVSLGTVQVALGQLQDTGLVQRRRGDGTRVSDTEPFTDNIWHFRFLSRDSNTPLRMVDSKLMMSRVSSAGYWPEIFGDQAFYFCFTRKIRMQEGTRAAAYMYIPGSLSKDLDKVDVSELEMVNIRPFLETYLNLKINRHTSRVSVVTPDKAEIIGLGLLAQQPYYEISAIAFTGAKTPVYYQRIFVSVADCNLEF